MAEQSGLVLELRSGFPLSCARCQARRPEARGRRDRRSYVVLNTAFQRTQVDRYTNSTGDAYRARKALRSRNLDGLWQNVVTYANAACAANICWSGLAESPNPWAISMYYRFRSPYETTYQQPERAMSTEQLYQATLHDRASRRARIIHQCTVAWWSRDKV